MIMSLSDVYAETAAWLKTSRVSTRCVQINSEINKISIVQNTLSLLTSPLRAVGEAWLPVGSRQVYKLPRDVR